MKKRINPPQCLIDSWKKIFINEQTKFIKSTHLIPDDLNTEFKDQDNEAWEIIGQMDNGDIVCRNVSANTYYIWDKWKVSQLKRPEKHLEPFKKQKIKPILPDKKIKPVNKKLAEQLTLVFDEIIINPDEKIIVEDSEISTIDLDNIDIPDSILEEPEMEIENTTVDKNDTVVENQIENFTEDDTKKN